MYSFDKVFFYSLKAFRVEFGYISVALQKVNYASQFIRLISLCYGSRPLQQKNKLGRMYVFSLRKQPSFFAHATRPGAKKDGCFRRLVCVLLVIIMFLA